jgi:hypothetical protein
MKKLSSPSIDEAMSILIAQETVLNTVPMFEEHRTKNSVQRAFAENCDPDDSIDVIRQYASCILVGIVPPTHVLLAVATRFKEYLDSDGSNLGDFFGAKRQQGKREPKVQRLKDEERTRVYYFMWEFIKLGNVSTLAAAGAAIEKFNLHCGRDHLEKAYYASGVAAIFDKGYEVTRDELTKEK